jgi:thiol-disulfide isomerase/thioredoxin
MAIVSAKRRLVASLACLTLVGGVARATDAPTPATALSFNPVHRDVQIDRPEAADIPKCTIKAERVGSATGWVVRDPSGQIIRKFIDTNKDDRVDQWCYYKDGVEVYRDIDSDFNKRADQFRWLNTAGSRHGIDTNDDGKIDIWQSISAEEVTAELVAALRDRDKARFERLLLSIKELKALGLGKARAEQLAHKIESAPAAFVTMANQQKVITPNAKWVSFGGSQPGTVPAGWEGSANDLLVYENVAAMAEADGKPQAIGVGTLVRVKDTWRLIDAPQLIDESVAENEPKTFFFTVPRGAGPETQVAKPTDKAQQLMEELRKLDAASENSPQEHERRAQLLDQLAQEAEPETRVQWYRQLADTLSAAAQNGGYVAGIDKLKALLEKIRADGKDDELASYIQYRWMTADHVQKLAVPNPDFAKIQTAWVEDLEKFIEESKKYPDSAEAMLELAISQEFSENEEQAVKWYDAIVKSAPAGAPIHRKAEGAKRRLQSVGTTIRLAGKTLDNKSFDLAMLKGKVVLIQYWATWCEPCKADMPLLKDLRQKFRGAFEVVGVCLDNDSKEMTEFLQENDPRWPQLFEQGGLESRFALEMGIQTLPTMVLVDKQGKVVSRNIRGADLDSEVKKLLK